LAAIDLLDLGVIEPLVSGDTLREQEGENQGSADQAHNQNILGNTGASKRAGRDGEECEENIGGPAHDSQSSGRVTVSAMKEV
jgi:hypothetical protein